MKIKIIITFFASSLLYFSFQTQVVYAEDLSISSNGSGSENTITASTPSEVAIQQNNSAEITNTVSTTSTTGNNQANQNTGDTTISTGSTQSTNTIDTQANTSGISEQCCIGAGTTSSILENGSGSNNTTSSLNGQSATVSISQNATIHNIITGTLNTGNNTASANKGNVTIRTGNITVEQSIRNQAVNTTSVSIPHYSLLNSVVIIGNGSGSHNAVVLERSNITTILTENNATFLNESTLVLNTGGNIANVNVGNVDIETGMIISDILISNSANSSSVTNQCCKSPAPSENQPGTPAPSTTITTSTSNGSNGSGSGASSGQVQAAAIGNFLPKTGGNWMVIFLLGNVIMLFLGMILRLRSGRSPGYAFAI